MEVIAIFATSQNGIIGNQGKLPWHLPNDLKYFKEQTLNQIIVMGKNTYEGIGKRALPNRTNIILTTNQNYTSDNAIIMHSVEEVLEYAKTKPEKLFIAGGNQIYKAFEPYTTTILKTSIFADFTGDTKEPHFDYTKFTKTQETKGQVDEKNQYQHTFEVYKKND